MQSYPDEGTLGLGPAGREAPETSSRGTTIEVGMALHTLAHDRLSSWQEIGLNWLIRVIEAAVILGGGDHRRGIACSRHPGQVDLHALLRRLLGRLWGQLRRVWD